MAREINKCSDPKNRPKSCYDYWDADKKHDKANMPLGALTSVYRKGLGAWLTGHKQGMPQHAWAMARVNSFIRGGKTRKVDKSEWEKVQKFRKKK